MLDRIKDLGFQYATRSGLSVGLDDMVIPETKYTVVRDAEKQVIAVQQQYLDGANVEHKYIDLTDTTPFGIKEFRIPFDATGKKWVRFSVWDSAGNGAWVQPTNLN
jgi:hypothetical protein